MIYLMPHLFDVYAGFICPNRISCVVFFQTLYRLTGQYQLNMVPSGDVQYFILYSEDRHPYLLSVEFLRDHIATYIAPIEYERGLKAVTLLSGHAVFSFFPEKGMESAKETEKKFLLHNGTKDIRVRLPKNTLGRHSFSNIFGSYDEIDDNDGNGGDDDDGEDDEDQQFDIDIDDIDPMVLQY
jgi:hypothetical protein